ncbi:MAG: hypothetical protein WKF84_01480 [Pyrinomonadaceae bacterium]
MTPSRALVDRAIRYHDSEVTLLSSPKFKAALPANGNANFSALFYHHFAPVIEPIARQVAQAASGATGSDQQEMLASLTFAFTDIGLRLRRGRSHSLFGQHRRRRIWP